MATTSAIPIRVRVPRPKRVKIDAPLKGSRYLIATLTRLNGFVSVLAYE